MSQFKGLAVCNVLAAVVPRELERSARVMASASWPTIYHKEGVRGGDREKRG